MTNSEKRSIAYKKISKDLIEVLKKSRKEDKIIACLLVNTTALNCTFLKDIADSLDDIKELLTKKLEKEK